MARIHFREGGGRVMRESGGYEKRGKGGGGRVCC